MHPASHTQAPVTYHIGQRTHRPPRSLQGLHWGAQAVGRHTEVLLEVVQTPPVLATVVGLGISVGLNEWRISDGPEGR